MSHQLDIVSVYLNQQAVFYTLGFYGCIMVDNEHAAGGGGGSVQCERYFYCFLPVF